MNTGLRAGLADALDDVARQRADVGAPVAADLGLVVDAAEACAHELAPGRARDAWPSEVLPTPGGPTAQDRALPLRVELADREILQDALLDLGQAVVVLVEDLAGLGDVNVVAELDQGSSISQSR